MGRKEDGTEGASSPELPTCAVGDQAHVDACLPMLPAMLSFESIFSTRLPALGRLKLCIFPDCPLRALRGSYKQCPVVALSMVSFVPQIRGIDPNSFFIVEEPEVQGHWLKA